MTDDLPQKSIALVPTAPSLTDAYAQFSQEQISLTVAAGNAYANKQPQPGKGVPSGQGRLAEHLVPGAEFFPAHPNRIITGSKLKKFKYFVIHRPTGLTLTASGTNANEQTLQAIVRRATLGASKDRIIMDFLSGAGAAVSTHFVLGSNGQLVQMVDLVDFAQHVRGARLNPKNGERVSNGNSVGVELEGFVQPYTPEDIRALQTYVTVEAAEAMTRSGFSAAMLQKLAWLLRWFHDNEDFALPLDRAHVLGHLELDPSNKTDPGLNFFSEAYDQVIQMAQSLPPITQKYQEPVDTQQAAAVAVQRYGNEMSRIASAHEKELALSMTSTMKGVLRASMIGSPNRRSDYNAATTHNATVVAARYAELAAKIRTNTKYQNYKPVPQKDRTGLRFDTATGEWR